MTLCLHLLQSLVIGIDSGKMAQVLLNLLHNAIQATGSAGTVKIKTQRCLLRGQRNRGAPGLEVSIVDNGSGISREDLEKLFIPFFTTKSRRTGLGLAICQRIIQAHDGELEVNSTPSKGSRFTVRLPLELPTPA